MTTGRIACALAVLAALCVLSIFFFPGMNGPYSSVHGPVTALLSLRAAARLRLLIPAGLAAVRSWIGSAVGLVAISLTSALLFEFFLCSPPKESLSVLRC
jgi:hypothetical protein